MRISLNIGAAFVLAVGIALLDMDGPAAAAGGSGGGFGFGRVASGNSGSFNRLGNGGMSMPTQAYANSPRSIPQGAMGSRFASSGLNSGFRFGSSGSPVVPGTMNRHLSLEPRFAQGMSYGISKPIDPQTGSSAGSGDNPGKDGHRAGEVAGAVLGGLLSGVRSPHVAVPTHGRHVVYGPLGGPSVYPVPGNSMSADPLLPEEPPVEAALAVKIMNPQNNGAALSFSVNGELHRVEPGYYQELAAAQGTVIEFDRGQGQGTARYTLQNGTYSFAATPNGWDLYQTPDEVARNVAASTPSPGGT